VGYSESFFGNNASASSPNKATERIESHHGWKTIGQRTTKMMNTIHRHVGPSVKVLMAGLIKPTHCAV
jgi:hypothetical protein